MHDAVPPSGHFLANAASTPDAQRLFDEDLALAGFVMNASRLWAHTPALHDELFELIDAAATAARLDFRQKAVLVVAAAAARQDSYCALAWSNKLAARCGDELPTAVLSGDFGCLGPAERALAEWARQIVRSPNEIRTDDVQPLRDAGFEDDEIVAITVFVALRLAFSSVNDALGARPDAELIANASDGITRAITFGRPVEANRGHGDDRVEST